MKIIEHRMLMLAPALMLLLGMSLPAAAQDAAVQDEKVEPAIEAAVQRTEQNQAAQQRIDAINESIQARIAEFQALQKEIEGLEVYKEQMRAQLANQDAEVAELLQSIEKVTLIERQITPLMLRMIDTLEEFVDLDLPFLKAEREQRVERLRKLIQQSDVSVSEKFRNVMSAWQTEVEYGRTIEAYRGTLASHNGGAEAQEVDFLRVGRLAIFYLSLDGKSAGKWDASSGEWKVLSSGFTGQINQGLRIAREQAAPDLIRLPLPTPEVMQ